MINCNDSPGLLRPVVAASLAAARTIAGVLAVSAASIAVFARRAAVWAVLWARM